jgi:cysteine desulfurase / selenocysteine lyase
LRAENAINYIAYLQIARKTGAVIDVVPDDETGQLSVEALRQMADERVRLIAITHVPTNGGLVNPVAEIGAVAREVGALYLLDACQSVGQMPVDVNEIGCDLLSVTGRKFLRGPRGTGLLYVCRSALEQLEPPLLDLHAAEWVAPDRYILRDDARRFENWETNVAAKLGLGAAIEYALGWGLEPIWALVSPLAERLRKQLSALPGVIVRDLGAVRCGVVSFTVEGADLTALRDALRAQDINISVSPRTYTLLDMQARALPAVLRASVHYYNTEDEIARFCEALARLLP